MAALLEEGGRHDDDVNSTITGGWNDCRICHFFIGAQKVQKNRFLWDLLGGLSLIPTFIFWPVLVGSVNAAGNDAQAIFISYFVIINAVGVFASIVVYKKILLKPAQLTVGKNVHVFCSECETQCPANTAFCNKCGSKIG